MVLMANLKIELANGYTFPAEECGVIPHVISTCEVGTALNVIGKLSEPGALDTMRVYNADDVLLMEYSNVVCDGFQGVLSEGTTTLHLYLREATERTESNDSEKAGVYDILFGDDEEEEE